MTFKTSKTESFISKKSSMKKKINDGDYNCMHDSPLDFSDYAILLLKETSKNYFDHF